MRASGAMVGCALAAAIFAGCGIGAGNQSGGVTLTVTRDFGKRVLSHKAQSEFPSGETVMRFLQRDTDVETRYGGRFVNAIDGVKAGGEDGRRLDWFYYVNGIEAGEGAVERDLAAGDRVWWDYHDWSTAMRVPAVVGSFPEPFRHGAKGKRFPVRIDCGTDSQPQCDQVAERLDSAGIPPSTAVIGATAGENVLRLVVGTWDEVRADSAARQLENGPQRSGVYAKPHQIDGDRYEFELLATNGRASRTLGAGSGLVAATRFVDQQPTWVVTGIDRSGVDRAAAMLDEKSLRNSFAVASSQDGKLMSLPISQAGQR